MERHLGVKKRLYIYINTTTVRSGLLDGLVYWILPRCREVGVTRRFISCHGAVRSVLPDGLLVCHDVVRSGLPTNGLPRCREVGFTQRFMMGIWYGTLLVSD